MPPRHSNMETEIKLPVSTVAEGARLLRAAGFRIARRRVFESNTLFDTADAKLRKAGQVLRVRQCGRRVLLTYKGPAVRGRHKSREELETGTGKRANDYGRPLPSRLRAGVSLREIPHRIRQRKGRSGNGR